MRHSLRFLWNATRGHRLAPWRSPYLLWRIETYCGVKMTQIGFVEFWEFLWRERVKLELQVQALLARAESLDQAWRALQQRVRPSR